ncbi:MAG: hypothetical protein A4S09_06115 [Proteobacteria bacterium SG_bin7]|nr:MAG: hypothetical protein A4S09_06115 [Proteobacteria bacterium SG_bin7]
MSKGRASKEAREPDVFLRISGEIINRLKPHTKPILIASVVIAMVAIAGAVLNFMQQNRELKAQSEYIAAEKAYVKKTTDATEAQTKIKNLETELANLKKPAKKEKNKETPRAKADIEKDIADAKAKQLSGDFEKDYGSFVVGFKKVINDAPETQAAIMASLYLAQIYAENKKFEEGISALSNSRLKYREGKLLYGLAQMKLGQLLEQSGKCQDSINTWQRVLAFKELSYFHPEATLATAVCYETLKNVDKAQELYKKTHADFKNSPAGANAQKYLRLLSLKGKDS